MMAWFVLLRVFLDQPVDRHGKIADPAAGDPADMVVLTGIPIDPNRRVCAPDFANQSFVGRDPEAAVNRTAWRCWLLRTTENYCRESVGCQAGR